LALVRGIVALHSGTIRARSKRPGHGSEFTVRLPLSDYREESSEMTKPTETTAAIGIKVLVVDDNRDAADACASLLELSGHQVQTVYTGRQALELAQTFRPDAVLLDIGLPDLNGYKVARKLRAQPWGRAILLVAVTAWGQAEDRRRAFEAGFDHHLTKPVATATVESLFRSMGRTIVERNANDIENGARPLGTTRLQ
jgi:CheY-like chemotaxis protein